MASLMIHHVVGQEYCKRHNIESVASFLKGNIIPDLIPDKKLSHFSVQCRNRTYTESIKNKVVLRSFCEKNEISSDFNKGIFLHLITDQVFFHQYLLRNPKYIEIENENQLLIQEILYRDYHRNNKYLMDKHPDLLLSFLPDMAKETREDIDNMELLSNEALDEMIDLCAGINLEYIYDLVKSMAQDNMQM